MNRLLHILFFFSLLFQGSILFGKTTVVHAPGIVTGSVEVVAQKVTDLTSLATLAYDVAVDKEVRSRIYNQFVEIKNEVGEDPKAFLPILVDVIVTVTTNKTPEQIQEIFDEKTNAGQRTHYATSATGNAIMTVMTGAAMVKDLPEIAEKLGENIKKVKRAFKSVSEMVTNIVNNRNTIRKVLDTDAGKVYARKYFDNIVKEGNFEDWYVNTFKKYDLGEPLNFEVHHVIPVNVLEDNPKLQDLLFKYQDKFDFNSIDNGIPLQKKRIQYDQPGHANHPDYDEAVREQIESIMESSISDENKFGAIKTFIANTELKLENDVLLGNSDVNNIISF